MGLFGSKQTVELTITGMTCGNCVRHVTEALEGVPGVVSASVSLQEGKAVVTAKPGKDGQVDRAALVAAVAEAGYEARP